VPPGPEDLIPDYARVPVQDVQVSLHRLLRLLRSTGRSSGFLLSGAVVPTIDVRALIELEEGGALDNSEGDTSEMYGSAAMIGGAGFQAVTQIFNPLGSGVMLQVLSARLNTTIAGTFNGEIHDAAFAVLDANGELVRGCAVIGRGDCRARLFGNDGTALPTRLEVFYQAQLTAGATQPNAFEEFVQRPIWIPGGRGLCVKNASNGAGTNGILNLRWREIPLI